MLHYETIDADTLVILQKLQKLPDLCNTRLVGGTSLALQLGHRKSIDLDLFGVISSDSENLFDSITSLFDAKALTYGKNINSFLVNGVKVDCVNFPYQWLEPPVEIDGICLAAIPDIAAMKVRAICNRGTKKDFIDLFELLKLYRITDILSFYKEKFPQDSEFIAIKSMTYFADAENDPCPTMIDKSVNWQMMKQTIIREVEAL